MIRPITALFFRAKIEMAGSQRCIIQMGEIETFPFLKRVKVSQSNVFLCNSYKSILREQICVKSNFFQPPRSTWCCIAWKNAKRQVGVIGGVVIVIGQIMFASNQIMEMNKLSRIIRSWVIISMNIAQLAGSQ